MLSTLITAVTLSLFTSFCCSLFEAVLYTISTSQVEMLKKGGRRSADLLTALRTDINRPITAILTMNTVANTVGATVAGVSAASVFGEQNLVYFSAVFTLSILIFAEIIPKTIGVNYAVLLAPLIARPLTALVVVLRPVIWLCQLVTRLIPHNEGGNNISAEELRTIATLSLQSGQIGADQERVINNILELSNKTVRQCMTPRTVTFSLEQETTIAEAMQLDEKLRHYSRIPLYHTNFNETTGIVLYKDILRAAAQDKNDLRLAQIMLPVHFVPETAPLNRVLMEFFERNQHLFVVVDEYGAMTGVISLEDILEEIVGREIMDESDQAKNMRELARRQYQSAALKSGQKE